MVRRYRKFFFYTIVILLCGAVPFIFESYYNIHEKTIQRSLEMVRTSAILLGSVLALIYFDPFGLSKKTVEEQAIQVKNVLRHFYNKRIFISFNTMAYKGFMIRSITRKTCDELMKDKEIGQQGLETKISFEINDYVRSFSTLEAIRNNIDTPKEISEKLNFFILQSANTKNTLDEEKHILLTFGKKDPNDQLAYTVTFNSENPTFKTFLTSSLDLIDSCEKWLKRYTFSSKGMNIS